MSSLKTLRRFVTISESQAGESSFRAFENGPYYVQLRAEFEEKLKVTGPVLRLSCVRNTGKEGKTVEGCPIAKWIMKRSGSEEEFVVVTKERYEVPASTPGVALLFAIYSAKPA